MKKLLFAFFSFFLASFAFAQTVEWQQCKEYSLSLDGPYQSDKEAVCREAARKCDSSAYYSCDYLSSSGDSCVYSSYTEDRSFRYSNTVRPFFSRKCEENKCSAKNGSLTWQYVPMGKIKITDLEKGTYDFKRVPPPAKVCFEGCEAGSPGKYVGVMGMRGVDLENTDSNGYHTTFSNIEYTFSGQKCIEGDQNIPGKPPENQDQLDEEKCKGKGGYFGQVNGKDVCLGVDEQNKCLPGQTYGQINGKDVCLTPEGEQLPVPKPGDKNQPGNGNDPDGSGGNKGNGTGNGTGNTTNNTNINLGGGNGNGDGDGEGDGKGNGAGPGFGDQPGLYEPRYKNGIKGVWDQKKGQIQNSGLGRLSKRLMPTVNSGTCPRWDVDLNFGRNMNFGTKNVAPPCTIWPILRAMVMVCALILARKLVFGA